jgi:hypothetical protein
VELRRAGYRRLRARGMRQQLRAAPTVACLPGQPQTSCRRR